MTGVGRLIGSVGICEGAVALYPLRVGEFVASVELHEVRVGAVSDRAWVWMWGVILFGTAFVSNLAMWLLYAIVLDNA